jgi:hypothetical protein
MRACALRGIAIEAITDPYKFYEQLTSLGNCALLGYYAGSSGNLLPTFRDNLSGPIFVGQLTRLNRTDTLSRNVGTKLLLLTA